MAIQAGRSSRGSLIWLALLAAVAAVVYVLFLRDTSEADYRAVEARIGKDAADRLLAGVMPVAMAKVCADRFGRDDAMIEAVAEFLVRNQPALAVLHARLADGGALTPDEEMAVEAYAMPLAEQQVPDQDACRAVTQRIADGAFDLPAPETADGAAEQ
ncbi:MAG: hypothetical protein R3F55_17910 [Alphaproteobacteria bacterium]